MPLTEIPRIEPADGKLGALIPGIGAVSTTFVAGVGVVKHGLGVRVGSLAQMGTIRRGKRTESRVPRINDFVRLASLEQLAFGGWDIYEDSAFEAAIQAQVLETRLTKLTNTLRWMRAEDLITHLGLEYYD